MRIACLHTAHSNIAVFDRAAASVFGNPARATLQHHVRPDLLEAAERAGGMTESIADATRAAMHALTVSADALLLTCSTLGPAADSLSATHAVPVLRVDRALARDALRSGGSVVVLCAVATTVAPTRQLFESVSDALPQRRTATVEVRVVAGAWDDFKAGDVDAYLRAIAHAAETAYAQGADTVALAQASMAGAAAFTRSDKTPLSSPAAGLRAVLAAVEMSNAQGAIFTP